MLTLYQIFDRVSSNRNSMVASNKQEHFIDGSILNQRQVKANDPKLHQRLLFLYFVCIHFNLNNHTLEMLFIRINHNVLDVTEINFFGEILF